MRLRLLSAVVVVCALSLAGCDLDERLPQSPKALSPGADRVSEAPMTGGEKRDHQLDRAIYVANDPL